jgi:CBS domain-containing protein
MDRSRLNRFINQPLRELPLEVPAFVEGSTSAREAVARMHNGSRSCVLVGTAQELAGILTERDILKKCMDDGFDWGQPVSAICTTRPGTMASNRSVADALASFQQHGYRTLPVTDEMGKVLGLVRVGDLMTQLVEAFPEEVLNLPPRPHQVSEKQEGG